MILKRFISSYKCRCAIFLDSVLNVTLQPSSFEQKFIGQRQDVICAVSVPPDVDSNTIKLGWFIILEDNSMVPINASSSYFNDSTLYTIIHFDLLTEEDEGKYTCYAIINGSFIYDFIVLQNFTCK